ncbi:Cytochrome oxidase assembly [Savitreella phatthalungensis]
MPTFEAKTYRRPGEPLPASQRLYKRVAARPVLLFGVPFIGIILAGAFVLSNTQTVRYERRDAKVKLLSSEEALGLEHGRRKVNARDEYYRLQSAGLENKHWDDDWEQKRIERLPGQKDNVLDRS